MNDFKYFITKLDDTFLGKTMSFLKTKNSFNKIFKEFKEVQAESEQKYNLLFPLERIFL